jgi:hypothetical protein
MRARRLVPALLAALAVSLVGIGSARATVLTFHLPAREALAGAARYSAFVASLGKQAKGVKLVPGGTLFAGQTCASFGEVYKLGAVTVLDGPARLHELVTTRKGKDAAALDAVFQLAGVAHWTSPPAEIDTDVPFWIATAAPTGARFAAEALSNGSDNGLLATGGDPGVLRFRADVTTGANTNGRYRFLVQLDGRTSSQDAALVKLADRRCFAFVDLAPLDVSVLVDLVQKTSISSATRRATLQAQLDLLVGAIDRRDTTTALDTIAVFTSLVTASVPGAISPAAARRIVTTAFDVRRGLLFHPPVTTCGNGTRETGEQCDGGDLGGFDCARLGFQGGTLACTASCRFETSACIANPVCGNGVVEPPEECDFGSDPVTGNSDSKPDTCRTNCKRPFCGDKVIDSFEDCEGKNLAGETCLTLGYDGGSLHCDPDECFFDDENCTLNDDE